MRELKSNISNEFRHMFCAVIVSFLHFSRKRYGPINGPTYRQTDGPTNPPSYRDARTHLMNYLCPLGPRIVTDSGNVGLICCLSFQECMNKTQVNVIAWLIELRWSHYIIIHSRIDASKNIMRNFLGTPTCTVSRKPVLYSKWPIYNYIHDYS